MMVKKSITQIIGVQFKLEQSSPVDPQDVFPWNLPLFSDCPESYDQNQYLHSITKLFDDPNNKMIVIYGEGCTKQTCLAKYIIHNPPYNYSYRSWFPSKDKFELDSGYSSLGVKLGIFQQLTPVEEKRNHVKNWFEHHPNWLLVYDNAKDYDCLIPYLPYQGEKDRIIITSRNSDWSQAQVIDVGKLEGDLDCVPINKKIIGRPDQNPFFIESVDKNNKSYLLQLRENLTRDNLTAITGVKSHTISGMGGIGKTQLAIAYTYKYEKDYDLIYWIDAGSKEKIIAAYKYLLKQKPFADTILQEEGLSLKGDTLEEIKEIEKTIEELIEDKKPDEIINIFVREIPKNYQHWLLVYDNVDNASQTKNLMPQKGGHIIVTSRCSEWNQILLLSIFQPHEAYNYLFLATQKNEFNTSESEKEAAKQIAKELGYLQLALAQAASYIRVRKIGFNDYLSDLKERQPQLLRYRLPGDDSYNEVVMTAWDITMDKLNQKYPLAETIMNRCAYLDQEGIPLEFFSDLPKEETEEAIQALHNYSMLTIKRENNRDSISIHKLVQDVIRIKLEKDSKHSILIKELTNLLLKENMFMLENTDIATMLRLRGLLPHLLQLNEHAQHYEINTDEQIELYLRSGDFLNLQNQSDIVLPLLNRALSITKLMKYKEKEVYSVLFNAYINLNQLDKIAIIPEEFLDEKAKAIRYSSSGEYEKAEELLLKILNETIQKDDCPGKDYNIAEIYNELGNMCFSKKAFSNAYEYLMQAKTIYEKLSADIRVARTSYKLGLTCVELQKISEARQHLQNALNIFEKIDPTSYIVTQLRLKLKTR